MNLHRRNADLAIRMVKPERGHLTLRRLGTLGYGLYCSNSYADTRSTQKDSANYDNDCFITWTEMQAHLPAAQWFERTMQGKTPTVSTTTLASQLAAAKAGLGLSVLPHFLAQEAGLRCLEADIGVEQPMYLVMHTDLVKSRRIRVLADFLSELIESNRERLCGVSKRRR